MSTVLFHTMPEEFENTASFLQLDLFQVTELMYGHLTEYHSSSLCQISTSRQRVQSFEDSTKNRISFLPVTRHSIRLCCDRGH